MYVCLIGFSLIFFVQGCIPIHEAQPEREKGQIQKREFQTRYFETADTKMVIKAVLYALQDDDFIITQANADLGLLTAKKEVDLEREGGLFSREGREFERLFGSILFEPPMSDSQQMQYPKQKIIEVSASISEFGEKVKVRANFLQKILDQKGATISVEMIDNQGYYQSFFSKISKSIFISKQKL